MRSLIAKDKYDKYIRKVELYTLKRFAVFKATKKNIDFITNVYCCCCPFTMRLQ